MNKMVRVGFVFQDTIKKWNGGINYYSNLIKILNDSKDYEPVVICSPELRGVIKDRIGNVETVIYDCLRTGSMYDKLRKAILYSTGHNLFLDKILRDNNITVVSHNDGMPLNKSSRVPSCFWIPDFQLMYYPDLFKSKDSNRTKKVWYLGANAAKTIVVSSESARKDLSIFFDGKYDHKVNVLQFALPPQPESTVNDNILHSLGLQKYKYFLITNQFWAHKNHIVVLNALTKIKEKYPEKDIIVIATGSTEDIRDPENIKRIKEMVNKNHLSDAFRCTGEINYTDVKVLQRYCMAVIQPSLFEGWNTTVEECKMIGKKIILSNLSVHKEQNPENVVYFDPYDSEELVMKLIGTFDEYDRNKEEQFERRAVINQSATWNRFAANYIGLLKKTIGD